MTDTTSANNPIPSEISYSIILTILGLIFVIFLIKNKKLLNFVKKKGGFPDAPKFLKTPYEGPDETTLDKSNLEKIADRLANNFRILITIYGILLAFIVSDKIETVFSSWPFMLWTGWILGVIIKAGWHLWSMSDLVERKSDLVEISREIYNQREFFKHMMILLAVAIAFLSMIVFLNHDSFDTKTISWSPSVTAISGAFGILATTFLFFMILHLFKFVELNGSITIYMYVFTLFIMSLPVGATHNSPLQPVLITVGDLFKGEVPSIFVSSIRFSSALSIVPLSIGIRLLIQMIPSKTKKN
jgi:hypothetical protein